MTKEEWKNVEGYVGAYQISNFGRLRSFRPLNGKGPLKDNPHILKASITKKGYYRVFLRCGNKLKHKFIHRLVLETFVGECPNGMETRHLDGNSKNNRLDNLKYGSTTENRLDRIKHGRNNNGENHIMTNLTNNKVRIIKFFIKNSSLSQKKIGELFGVSRDVINKIKNNVNWKSMS